MFGEIEIRKALPYDCILIDMIIQEAFEGYVPKIGGRPKVMNTDFNSLVNEGVVYVAVENANIIGSLVLEDYADHLLIKNVAVLKH